MERTPSLRRVRSPGPDAAKHPSRDRLPSANMIGVHAGPSLEGSDRDIERSGNGVKLFFL